MVGEGALGRTRAQARPGMPLSRSLDARPQLVQALHVAAALGAQGAGCASMATGTWRAPPTRATLVREATTVNGATWERTIERGGDHHAQHPAHLPGQVAASTHMFPERHLPVTGGA